MWRNTFSKNNNNNNNNNSTSSESQSQSQSQQGSGTSSSNTNTNSNSNSNPQSQNQNQNSRSTSFRRANSARKKSQKVSAFSSLLNDTNTNTNTNTNDASVGSGSGNGSGGDDKSPMPSSDGTGTGTTTGSTTITPIQEETVTTADGDGTEIQMGATTGPSSNSNSNNNAAPTSTSTSTSQTKTSKSTTTAAAAGTTTTTTYETIILNSNDGSPIDQPSSASYYRSKQYSNFNHVMVSAFNYMGLELLITCQNRNPKESSSADSGDGSNCNSNCNGDSCIQLITARSRMTLQTLYLPDFYVDDARGTHNKNSNSSNNVNNVNNNGNNSNYNNQDEFEVEIGTNQQTEEEEEPHEAAAAAATTTTAKRPKKKLSNVRIVTMKTNSISGCISVITSNCKCITYYPVPAPPSSSSSSKSFFSQNGGANGNDNNIDNVNVNAHGSGANDNGYSFQQPTMNTSTVFGNYNWILGQVIDLTTTFSSMVDQTLGRKLPTGGVGLGLGLAGDGGKGGGKSASAAAAAAAAANKMNSSAPSSISSSGVPSQEAAASTTTTTTTSTKSSAVVQLGLSSIDYKLLIAYGDQIAIYSIPPPPTSPSSSLSSMSPPTLSPTPKTTTTSSTTSTSTSLPNGPKSPPIQKSKSTTPTMNNLSNTFLYKSKKALLQWTTRVRATITNCDISGDGRSIVYTLEKEGVGVSYPHGVRTFIRDVDDGSEDHRKVVSGSGGNGNGNSNGNSISNSERRSSSRKKERSLSSGSVAGNESDSSVGSFKGDASGHAANMALNASGHGVFKKPDRISSSGGSRMSIGGIQQPPVPLDKMYNLPPRPDGGAGADESNAPTSSLRSNMGILYKPGPFLVHSKPVTRLSFRGVGVNYSSISTDYEMRKKKKMRRRRSRHRSSSYSSAENIVIVEGNDLLLTSCSSDGSMRVFSQGTWKMLLHWDTPPGSRADWIQGITMANLGDLDPFPKSSKKKKAVSSNGLNGSDRSGTGADGGSSSSSRGKNYNSTNGGSGTGSVNKQLIKAMTARNGSNSTQVQTIPTSTTSSGGWNTHPSPQCAAGAWISELTFRGPFPALRLSRLSFLKSGGGDAWAPAHFESVAAILPPATVLSQGVLESFCGDEGMGMVVQGVWPAWNRWVAHPNAQNGAVEDESLSGNAMSLLGAVPQGMMSVGGGGTFGVGGAGNLGSFGGAGGMSMASFGGSHSPPSELRLVASHPDGDKVVVMEFPLWGDSDFGAMELGSPLRHLLSLNEDVPHDVRIGYGKNVIGHEAEVPEHHNVTDRGHPTQAPLPVTVSTRCACLDFESSNLCAVATRNRKRITLTWRKKGTMNIDGKPPAPLGEYEQSRERTFSNGSIASTVSLDSSGSHTSFLSGTVGTVIDQFSDMSLVPVPLSLPSLHLPVTTEKKEVFSLLKWWPDENFGGPPRLFALTNLGTLILYEMPPPWSALEPIMPMDDPFAIDAMSSLVGMSENSVVSERTNEEEGVIYENEMFRQEEEFISEYEVHVTPHSDFGLGLRLEAQADGMPAIAGSYKKHPLTGGRLPAEKTGKIVLGDELISVNDISLEGMTFDDIISSVRLIGSKNQGGPLKMKFRPVEKNRFLRENLSNLSAEQIAFEEGLEVVHQRSTDEGDEMKSSASVMVGAEGEMQQGFGRVVAVVPNALPSFTSSVDQSPRSLLLLPWHYGKGAPIPYQALGAVILVSAVGRKITTSRLEILNGADPGLCGVLSPLGSVELDSNCDSRECMSPIKSLEIIKNSGDGWCIAASDEVGDITLVFIEIVDCDDDEQENKFRAIFRTDFIFNCGAEENIQKEVKDYLVRAPSIELLGTMPVGGSCNSVNVWTSTPFLCCDNDNKQESKKDETEQQNYSVTKIYHRGDSNCSHRILDFRWISSGCVDSFPWLVTFSNRSVVVHRRPGWNSEWQPIAEVTYPLKRYSRGAKISLMDTYQGSLSPADAFPHLMAGLRTIVSATDERNYIKSDWNPDSILAFMCSDPGGVELGMKRHVGGLLKWLSKWMDPTDSTTVHWDSESKLPSAPFTSIYDKDAKIGGEANEAAESAEALMKTLSKGNKTKSKEEILLEKLQMCLKELIDSDKENKNESETNHNQYSREFNLVFNNANPKDKQNQLEEEYALPEPLKTLSKRELNVLWVIGETYLNPPNFKKLDETAKLSILAIALLRSIQGVNKKDSTTSDLSKSSVGIQNRSFLVKQPSSLSLKTLSKSSKINIPSSAALGALVSDTQSQLLQVCRKPNERLDWDTTRSISLPLWLRSDEELQKISEEIGQSTYKNTMDVLEAALFYVIIGNTKKLKILAATDKNQSGRTFFKFLTAHDFTTSRGRTAAEKNAYSLLRKRRYRPAAAFFLLSEPPMIKSALEIILTKMEDFVLAFFVARLMDANSVGGKADDGNSLTIGGGFSLRSMGGGGGFASTAAPMNIFIEDESPYSDWKPKLSKTSRDLLKKFVSQDACLTAIQSLWLGRPNDAAMQLMGRDTTESNPSSLEEHIAVSLSTGFLGGEDDKARTMAEVNSIIDFTSRPSLLKKLKIPKHATWFSSLQISRALCRRGFELSAIMTLPMLEDKDANNTKNSESILSHSDIKGQPSDSGMATSSIFDSFGPPVKAPEKSQQPSSTIFDDYKSPSDNKQSSIFDSFDAPSSSNKTNIKVPRPNVTSSIFDSFDPPPSKPTQSNSSSTMVSSIFDSFDVPVSSRVKATSQPPQAMSSSIFDSFDVPSSNKTTTKRVETTGNDLSESKSNSIVEDDVPDVVVDTKIADISIPPLWLEWRRNILTSAVAKRLLREMARIIAPFLGDTNPTPMKLFRRHIQPLIPYGASHVLQEVCEGETVLSLIVEYLEELCNTFDVSKESVIEQALILLACPSQPRRIVFAVLLHCLTARADLAEDVMRHAAHDQMQRCETFIAANDDLFENRKTKHNISSQYVRRQAAMVSLQLELCLWLHRGGAFPMSGLALKETTIGVRVGLVVAAWGRCHECLENMIKCEPDCVMDFERGRQLWSSMKMILSFSAKEEKNKDGGETTSGGWEFLVDCNREEATDLLRNRKCGSFLLRPHPDDHGVFTLSFRTNLTTDSTKNEEIKRDAEKKGKPIKRDDVVQHAVVRLSDAGFKCGSFGPFSSLLKLLEAVSVSLPFDLLFSEPPAQGIIKEEGGQPSPNSVFIRKLALHSKTDHYRWNSTTRQTYDGDSEIDQATDSNNENELNDSASSNPYFQMKKKQKDQQTLQRLGVFSQLLVLTELRKQFSAVVAADDDAIDLRSHWDEAKNNDSRDPTSMSASNFDGSLMDSFDDIGEEEMDAIATRTIRPFLNWCRAFEIKVVHHILPMQPEIMQFQSSTTGEILARESDNSGRGDGIIRRMIQPRSGVEFRTLRVGEAGHSAVIVLFRKSEAISWIVSSGAEKNESDAIKRLNIMEKSRVIEQVDLNLFAPDKQVVGLNGQEETDFDGTEKEIRFRFVDPWEVEVIESKDAELRSASLGRQRYVPFTLGSVVRACEDSQRSLGGLHLLSLWSSIKGGACLTKAFASVFPPWERDCGGDLYVVDGMVTQPSSYSNSFRQHLYRNAIFRRLNLPQRFIALVQVELLDLKNLTSPGGSPSLTAYALLRLKRDASNAPLTHKARTLDSASTEPRKISKSSGPNAPASWGSVVRFRFPLPEGVNSDGVSFDKDREALFKGAPSVLQLSVYEKKFMNDVALGGADVRFDGLSTDGQVEEWVPLRSANDEITWFARIRLMLRFELMCMDTEASSSSSDITDSAGLKKIRLLSRIGGAQEDAKGVQKSISTPDMVSAFQSMNIT